MKKKSTLIKSVAKDLTKETCKHLIKTLSKKIIESY
jgi:hypothetical protein